MIKEAKAGGEIEEIGNATVSNYCPIVSDESCYAYEIVFDQYVAYSIRNECFVSQDDSEEFIGRLICLYSKSHFLDYVRAATFASDEYPGHLRHYGINCLNHIIDVVSVDEPKINIARQAQQSIKNESSVD